MNWAIILYGVALYLLRGHKSANIRTITNALAAQWLVVLVAWMLNGAVTAPIVVIAIRAAIGVWLIYYIGTTVARRVGYAGILVILAYLAARLWPDYVGQAFTNAAVFIQLAFLAWGAWGDGLARLADTWRRHRRDNLDLDGGLAASARQNQRVDQ